MKERNNMGKRNKQVTREDLERFGVLDLVNQDGHWGVVRLWWGCGARGNSRTEDRKIKKIIWEKNNVCKHKYTSDKQYPIIVFSKGPEEGPLCLPVSRLVYAWHYGIVPEGMVVDHIDNNPFNNSLDNLQLLTDEENNRKRFTDLEAKCFNQYHNTKKE